ncbi:MAG: aldehyde dehydrogenase family protein [Nitrospirota bacterium]|nr:aldehyde dehydrogenase family protein [Nitrospirota bacterium]
MGEVHRNFINGEWLDSSSGKTFKSRNPANGDVVGEVVMSTKDDVDRAVTAATAAAEKWRLVPAPRRGEMIYKVAEILARRKDELGRLVTREMGKVLPEGLGDVQEAIDMAYYMAGEGRRLSGETVPSELPNKDCKSVRVPVGVFGLVTPWNFPVAIPSWKMLPALICGNTVVIKPSSDTPICASEFVKAFEEAGIPKGVVNLVQGSGGEVGEALVTHPGVHGVSFTGSCRVGERLHALCGGLGKEFAAEMGGKNAIIVMDDADLDLAVEGALWGGFGTTGQRCTATSRLIVHEKIHDRFVEMFRDRASKLVVGDGLLAKTQMGPLINAAAKGKVLQYIEIGCEEGATLALGGKELDSGDRANGYFVEPTIFTGVTPQMRLAQEEVFGPVVSVIKVSGLEEAIRVVNGVKYGLSASIYTRDVNKSAVAERDIDTGIVYINAPTIGAEIQLPFGGTRGSGIGSREAGGRGGALDLYSKWKVIYRDFSGALQKAQIDKD